MQELEKILEEMQSVKEIMLSPTNKDCFGEPCKESDCCACVVNKCMEIVRKHMIDGWVPVEERLPEEGEQVLVWYEYFRYGDYNCMFQTYGIGYQYDGHWSGDVNGVKARCIAWRPLPEPYKPERSEEE